MDREALVPGTAPNTTADLTIHSEGAGLRARLHFPTPSRGTTATVIWSHGYGAYLGALGAPIIAEELPAAGYAVLTLDHRGCGRSQASPRGKSVQGVESVSDLMHAVSYIRGRADIGDHPIVLMGESHGGASALAAGALDDRVAAVCTADAFADGKRWLDQMWADHDQIEKYKALLNRAECARQHEATAGNQTEVPITEIIPYGPEDLELFYQLCDQHPDWSRTASLAAVDSIGRLQPITLSELIAGRPVQLIHGGADTTVPATDAELLHAKIPGSTLEVIPGVGHGVIFSHSRSDIITLIIDWLAHVTTQVS